MSHHVLLHGSSQPASQPFITTMIKDNNSKRQKREEKEVEQLQKPWLYFHLQNQKDVRRNLGPHGCARRIAPSAMPFPKPSEFNSFSH